MARGSGSPPRRGASSCSSSAPGCSPRARWRSCRSTCWPRRPGSRAGCSTTTSPTSRSSTGRSWGGRSQDLVEATAPVDVDDPIERLGASMEAYVDYVCANLAGLPLARPGRARGRRRDRERPTTTGRAALLNRMFESAAETTRSSGSASPTLRPPGWWCTGGARWPRPWCWTGSRPERVSPGRRCSACCSRRCPGRCSAASRTLVSQTRYGVRVAYTSEYPFVYLTVDIVVLTIREDELHALVVRRGEEPYAGKWALPGGLRRPGRGPRDRGLCASCARRPRCRRAASGSSS